jgi:hypothetical protein
LSEGDAEIRGERFLEGAAIPTAALPSAVMAVPTTNRHFRFGTKSDRLLASLSAFDRTRLSALDRTQNSAFESYTTIEQFLID